MQKVQADRTFWHNEIGFVCDIDLRDMATPSESTPFNDPNFAEALEQTGKLPPLDDAPVASWLLARLLDLTRFGMALDERETKHNDGGMLFLKWISFSRDFKPLATFQTHCYSDRINLVGHTFGNSDPISVQTAFIAALVENPITLRKCSMTIVDMDSPSKLGKAGRRYNFGWNGKRFLGTRDYE